MNIRARVSRVSAERRRRRRRIPEECTKKPLALSLSCLLPAHVLQCTVVVVAFRSCVSRGSHVAARCPDRCYDAAAVRRLRRVSVMVVRDRVVVAAAAASNGEWLLSFARATRGVPYESAGRPVAYRVTAARGYGNEFNNKMCTVDVLLRAHVCVVSPARARRTSTYAIHRSYA